MASKSIRKPAVKSKAQALDFAEKKGRQVKKAAGGQVPEGDVRLTVNIRRDLHVELRKLVARRIAETGERFTAGQLIEEWIEREL